MGRHGRKPINLTRNGSPNGWGKYERVTRETLAWYNARRLGVMHRLCISQREFTNLDPATRQKELAVQKGLTPAPAGGRRATPSKPNEIQHSELDRIRAEHIRRYSTADKAEAVARDGFVYVMAHSIYSPGIVKIGHSRDPYRRVSQANTNSAEGQHRIIYMRFFKDRALVESLVHSHFWDQRVQGEHFRIGVGDAIRFICQVDE